MVGPVVVVLAGAVLLVAVAETWGGRLTGLAFGAGSVSSLLWLFRFALPSGGRLQRPAAAASGVGAAALLAAMALAPSGETASGSRIESVWTGEARYRRFGLANLVPEIDQFTLASYLVAVDPMVDLAQSRAIRADFLSVYRALRQVPEVVELGSAMPDTYLDLAGGGATVGHLYVVHPSRPPPAPRPTAVFLHGSLGPFKGYAWVLRGLADRCGVTVVAPAYGAGWWFRDARVPAVRAALTYIEAQPELAAPHTLMGLSGGGFGVSRAAVEYPDHFDHLVYLSAILEPEWLPRSAAARPRTVHVLWGTADRRISDAHSRVGVASLEAAGAAVHTSIWEGDDHFLFFHRPDPVLDAVARHLPGCRSP